MNCARGPGTMRSIAFGSVGLLLLAACASSSNDGASSTQDSTAASLLDGQNLTDDQLATAVPAGNAAILFSSRGGAPTIRGQLVAGAKVTVVYALNRLSQCRTTHDGFQIWDTLIGGGASNGMSIAETSVRAFPDGSSLHTAESAPFTFTVPEGAESFFLYAHNTAPGGPAPACDTYDSNNSANWQFQVQGNSQVGVNDFTAANADTLAQLVDIGDGSNTAAILFGQSGQPVVKGNLVQGGKVVVAFALDRLPQCRALHDGYPFWVTQIGGQFSDGTKVGEATGQASMYSGASNMAGHVVRFTPIPNEETPVAQSTPTVFTIPDSATDLALWAHNWNPGGPVEACSAYDSLAGANYHFPIRSK